MACNHQKYIYRAHMCLAEKKVLLKELLDQIYDEASTILEEEDASKDDMPYGPLPLILIAMEQLSWDEDHPNFGQFEEIVIQFAKGYKEEREEDEKKPDQVKAIDLVPE